MPGLRGAVMVRGMRLLRSRITSFADAARGIWVSLRTQRNAQIQTVAAIAVIITGVLLPFSAGEWLAVILAIGCVMSTEAMNTAVEHLADAAVPQRHPLIRNAKDAAAGAVLLASLAAVGVAGVIAWRHLTAS